MKGDSASAASLTELPVPLISENPDNPRNHLRNLDETMDTVRELGIIMPIVVATAEAYLRDRPDRADDLDDGAQYVVVDGHRRLECARRIGLAVIPVRVDNARVATDEALLEAAFVANYHRDDMTDLEEAHALKQLVDYYGSQTKASKRLGIPQNTISTKLSLLKLTPELQKDLMTGERKVEHVRNLGKLSPEEQREKADERAAAAETRRETQRPAPVPPQESEPMERAAGPADYHGVIIPEPPAEPKQPAPQPPATTTRAEPASGQIPPDAVPEPRTPPLPEGKRFPYDNPGEAALLMKHEMDHDMHFDTFRLMFRTECERNPERLNELLDSERPKGAL
ncbi:ParB/RepB/Spo0J family partition protein [Streptomyces violaceus]|uniref:ParB/RepB/Spo0J family partition protein n=1 Tax=Streptomyces violaceus TaxID=1936 RepID=UPI003570E801